MSTHVRLASDRKEHLGVAPRQVCNRHKLTFLPEQGVRKRGNVAHMDAGTDHARHPFGPRQEPPAPASPTGAKMIAASSGCRGARPNRRPRPRPARGRSRCASSSPGRVKAKTSPALPARDLRDDVRRCAEAVNSRPPALARHLQRRQPIRPAQSSGAVRLFVVRLESGRRSARRRPRASRSRRHACSR